MTGQIRERVYEIVECAREEDRLSRWFDLFIMGLITLNVVAVILETVEPIAEPFTTFFWAFEVLSVSIFTVEYALRVWSCAADPRFGGPVLGRLRYMVSWYAIVDLLAILPFYLSFAMADLRIIRALRLTRIVRVLKIARYSRSMRTLAQVLRETKEELTIAAFVGALLLLVASSLMYFAERDAQPEKFTSIPAALWWGVSTLTTVGYGDVYPVTGAGKALGAVVSVLGIGLFAMPAGILGSGFVEHMRRSREAGGVCPHCGEFIADAAAGETDGHRSTAQKVGTPDFSEDRRTAK